VARRKKKNTKQINDTDTEIITNNHSMSQTIKSTISRTTDIIKKFVDKPTEPKPPRFDNIDLARGFALLGMFMSHGVKSLLVFDQMPEWGIVPIHLITKFSSSLFVLVFGISLSLFFTPHVNTIHWPKKRNRLLLRSIEIMFWYKALTIVQMYQTYPRELVVDTLMFKRFPDFVEVLGFYSFILMWIPFFLPLWARSNTYKKLAYIVGVAATGVLLNKYFGFWGIPQLKAILVENKGYYTYGQFQRGALVMLGLLMGDFLKWKGNKAAGRIQLAGILLVLSALLGGWFYYLAKDNMTYNLFALAKNFGKHPPNLLFTTFSLSAAFLVGSISLFGHTWLPKALKPITIIGKNSLFAFIFHIFALFVVYRYIINLQTKVEYSTALWLTGLLIVSTYLGCIIKYKRQGKKL
jgi:uncharacterized membrane protein